MRFVGSVSGRTKSLLLIAFVGLGLMLAGCATRGQDTGAEKASASSGTHQSTEPAKVIEITMKNFKFEPSSITIPTGEKVKLEFTNRGSVEHEFMAGKSVAESGHGFKTDLFAGVDVEKMRPEHEEHAEEGEEEHAEEGEEHHEGEHHGTMLDLAPGTSGSMTFTLPASKAGTYTMGCFETTGGKTHFKMGMKGIIEVVEPTA